MEFPIRINKYLAEAGYATRRSADALIEEGRVFVNGEKAVLGQKVTESDVVELKDFSTKDHRYILYYKPRGIVTHSPAEFETDIETQIKKDHNISGVFPIGRLDKESEGLILLTNDGRVTKKMLDPEVGHEREYEVVVDKRVPQTVMNALSKGVNIEGYRTKPAKAEKRSENENMFNITLTEGKRHQVRRMCAKLGYQVLELKRVRIGSLELKRLKPGALYELNKKEAKQFLASLQLPASD